LSIAFSPTKFAALKTYTAIGEGGNFLSDLFQGMNACGAWFSVVALRSTTG